MISYLDPSYHAYIKSARWKAKTELYWNVYGRYCRACGAISNLHVHHMDYTNFTHEPLADLAGLCFTCHNAVHKAHRKTGRNVPLRLVTLQYIRATRLKRTSR